MPVRNVLICWVRNVRVGYETSGYEVVVGTKRLVSALLFLSFKLCISVCLYVWVNSSLCSSSDIHINEKTHTNLSALFPFSGNSWKCCSMRHIKFPWMTWSELFCQKFSSRLPGLDSVYMQKFSQPRCFQCAFYKNCSQAVQHAGICSPWQEI